MEADQLFEVASEGQERPIITMATNALQLTRGKADVDVPSSHTLAVVPSAYARRACPLDLRSTRSLDLHSTRSLDLHLTLPSNLPSTLPLDSHSTRSLELHATRSLDPVRSGARWCSGPRKTLVAKSSLPRRTG